MPYRCLNCNITSSYKDYLCDAPGCGFRVGRFVYEEEPFVYTPAPPGVNDYFWSIVGSFLLGGAWAVVYLVATPILAFVSTEFRSTAFWASYPSQILVILCGVAGFFYGLYIYVYKLLMKDR